MLAQEAKRPKDVSAREHEKARGKTSKCQKDLADLQEQLSLYFEALAKIAGVASDKNWTTYSFCWEEYK